MHKQQQTKSLNSTTSRTEGSDAKPIDTSLSSNEATQQDLVDLQPDRDSLLKRLIGPRVIILTFLSLMFISKNIYNIYVIGIPDGNSTNASNSTANATSQAEEKVPEDDSVMERMWGYCLLTAVLFVLYIMLVRSNDRALMRKIQQEKKKIQEQEEQKIKNQQNSAEIKKEMIQEKNDSAPEKVTNKKQE